MQLPEVMTTLGGLLGDATRLESFLLFISDPSPMLASERNSSKPIGSPAWTLLRLWLWSVLCFLSGVDRRVCSVFLRKICHTTEKEKQAELCGFEVYITSSRTSGAIK